ncbi:MAG: clan AA aspartic protease [Elusimicrobia bacterium]|nr:clan AA aspartic protease [Elusimicrobiota bacterium]
MGMIHVKVSLRPTSASRKSFEAKFLADTGATDSMAPARALKAIGVKAVGRTSYELADGVSKEFEFGTAVIEFMGEVTAGRIIFGPDGAEPILGATALESTGVIVDPRRQALKKLPSIPLK